MPRLNELQGRAREVMESVRAWARERKPELLSVLSEVVEGFSGEEEIAAIGELGLRRELERGLMESRKKDMDCVEHGDMGELERAIRRLLEFGGLVVHAEDTEQGRSIEGWAWERESPRLIVRIIASKPPEIVIDINAMGLEEALTLVRKRLNAVCR